MLPAPPAPLVRRRIRVRGQVQGVGFRPHVWHLARELGLSGWVRNDGDGVEIDAEGGAAAVDALLRRLASQAPLLARVDAVEIVETAASVDAVDVAPAAAPARFEIVASGAGANPTTQVAPDAAPCDDCLAEMFDPRARRWRHAFVNCTHCGPRYTITRALPYDRAQTSMAGFAMCADCAREYADPADRRFHAQPIACPACGPRLRLLDPQGSPADAGADPIAAVIARLARGQVVAVKGVGGYQLLCDARQPQAVAMLRARKDREAKPLALMVANVASLAPFAELDAAVTAALASRERPIVLARKRTGCDAALAGIAPGLAWIGAMLPASPLHHLLFHEAAGRPAGTAWLHDAQPLVLVATSANPGGEPIVRDDDEALARLAGIADVLLQHDRAIVTRCDDSVLRVDGGAVQYVRRARGATPRAIRLPRIDPPVLAFGALLKSTVCATRGDEAFVSQHVGDLDDVATRAAYDETVDRLLALLAIEPQRVACDLHPDFHASRAAAAFAERRGLPRVAVQHHHAHIAAVAAEHGACGPLLGVALDGFGLGADGGAWGGELLVVDGAACRRVGHLATLPLPGGDRAAREPWRMAAALLHRIGRGDEIAARWPQRRAAAGLAAVLDRAALAPPTSSAGRWFDAAAALLGLHEVVSFEGQAAMALEGLADRHGAVAPLADGWRLSPDGVLDPTPLAAALAAASAGRRTAAFAEHSAVAFAGPGAVVDDVATARGAALFHATLAAAIADWVGAAARREGLDRVALGGGCWLNRALARDVASRLAAAGLRVLQAAQLPPNDGAISLGQAWVALHTED